MEWNNLYDQRLAICIGATSFRGLTWSQPMLVFSSQNHLSFCLDMTFLILSGIKETSDRQPEFGGFTSRFFRSVQNIEVCLSLQVVINLSCGPLLWRYDLGHFFTHSSGGRGSPGAGWGPSQTLRLRAKRDQMKLRTYPQPLFDTSDHRGLRT